MKKLLESLQECGMDMPPAPMNQGTPVSMNVSLNASGTEHVEDLIRMMRNAGLDDAKPVAPDMMPMRQDMDRLRAIVGEPGDEDPNEELEPTVGEEEFEGYDNEPDEDYKDDDYMTQDLSGGINRKKKMYAKAQDGDNAMAVETIKAALMAALTEKKKPDANKNGIPDYAEDGKGANDLAKGKKGSKPKKGEVPPQFKKK